MRWHNVLARLPQPLRDIALRAALRVMVWKTKRGYR